MPPTVFAWIHQFFDMKERFLLAHLSRSRLLCNLYYAFISPVFRREQQAVTAGLALLHSPSDQNSNRTVLRRNIHRLEKGLLMRPRRNSFALSYIVDTASCYEKCCNDDSAANWAKDLAWAHDILEHYFEVVEGGEQVETAREIFLRAPSPSEEKGGRIPYSRRSSCRVSFDDFMHLAKHRRSVRWFLQTPVPHTLIDKAVEVAAEAPTACNRQPFFYRFFDDPDALNCLRPLPLGTAGFEHNIPVLCAVIGDLSACYGAHDRHEIYVDASLSVMTFMYALETMGLSSCPLNWSEIESQEKEAERLLGLKKHERVIMFIALGYPDPQGLVAFSQKKDLPGLRSYNQPKISPDDARIAG